MSSRFGATVEHVWKDHAHQTGAGDPLGWTATGAAKAYDAISGIGPSVLGVLSANEYVVAPRDGISAATRAAVSNTLDAQWFKSGPGRILNVIPKAITAVLELPDGLIRDGLQVLGGGGSHDGYVIKTVR